MCTGHKNIVTRLKASKLENDLLFFEHVELIIAVNFEQCGISI